MLLPINRLAPLVQTCTHTDLEKSINSTRSPPPRNIYPDCAHKPSVKPNWFPFTKQTIVN